MRRRSIARPILCAWEQEWFVQMLDYVSITSRNRALLAALLDSHKTRTDVASKFGLSSERVRQIMVQGIRRFEIANKAQYWKV